ncbi:MAG: mechanosensitive ion channel [Candidatus Bathyarchaeia archaeon]
MSAKRKDLQAVSFKSGGLKTLTYIIFLSILLSILNFLLSWSSRESIPQVLQPYSDIIFAVNPYLIYIQSALILAIGYLIVNSFSNTVYIYMRRLTDHPTAATMKTIVWTLGIAILLVIVTSILSAGPWTALTVGSFGGLVVGFATQTVLSHFVAGIFIILTRPFRFGDMITIAGQTGIVKEMKIMHLILETKDGSTEILIPNGMVFTQIILRRKIVVEETTTQIHELREEIESIKKATEMRS